MNADLQKLRSHNEEVLTNSLQEIENKQKNLYSDVNSRLSNVETVAVLDMKNKLGAQIVETNLLRDQNEELARKLQEIEIQQAKISKQQTSSMPKLQAQIDLLNTELRRLRSQNEDLLNNLQDVEKRQKEFYMDMDASLRHLDTVVAGTSSAPSASQPTKSAGGGNLPPSPAAHPQSSSIKATNGSALIDTITIENRAYELAYGHVKASNYQDAISAFQEFLKKYPESKHEANILYELGNANFALKDYKSALENYRLLLSKYPSSPDVPVAMLSIADSQYQLKAVLGAKKTLSQIVAKYPGSKIADQAKKRLDNIK